MHTLSFEMIYGELEAALKLNKEARLVIDREKAPTAYEGVGNVPLYYTGQGRYDRDPKQVRREERTTQQKMVKVNPLNIDGWRNWKYPKNKARDWFIPMK